MFFYICTHNNHLTSQSTVKYYNSIIVAAAASISFIPGKTFLHHNNNNNGNVNSNCNNHHLRVFALMPIVCALLNDLIRQREIHEMKWENFISFYVFFCVTQSSLFMNIFHNSELTVGGGRYRLWWLVKVIRWLTNWVEMMRSRRYWVMCGSKVTLKRFIADKNPVITEKSLGLLHSCTHPTKLIEAFPMRTYAESKWTKEDYFFSRSS